MPGLEQAELFQSGRPEPARRVFLGWDRPLLDLATDFLATGLEGELSGALIVVRLRCSNITTTLDGIQAKSVGSQGKLAGTSKPAVARARCHIVEYRARDYD